MVGQGRREVDQGRYGLVYHFREHPVRLKKEGKAVGYDNQYGP